MIDFNKLKDREKIMVIALGSVVVLVLISQVMLKPLSKESDRLQKKIHKESSRLEKMKDNLPQLDLAKDKIEGLRKDIGDLKDEVARRDSDIPSKKDTSEILGYMNEAAKTLSVDSIHQEIDEGDAYSRLFTKIDFYGTFKDAVEYVRRVEAISPQIKVEELVMENPKKQKSTTRIGKHFEMMVSVLLADESHFDMSEALARAVAKGAIDLRDIFQSDARPKTIRKDIDLKLEGLTLSPRISTAIISGEVVREGSVIKEYEVRKILNNAVVLFDGTEEFTLTSGNGTKGGEE
jgi:Tfp pilus assembly protein PilO